MAIVTFNPWLPPNQLAVVRSTTVHVGHQINASGEKLAVIFRAKKTGNIAKATVRVSAVGSAVDIKVSFQNVDASGDPDGTPDQYRVIPSASIVAATLVQTGLITNNGADGGIARAVTAGDVIACVLEFDSTVGDVTFSSLDGPATGLGAKNSAYLDEYLTGAWVKNQTVTPALTITYDDGTVVPIEGCYPGCALNAGNTYSNASGTYRYGNYMVLSAPKRAVGAWAIVDLDGDADLVLYDSDGTTVLGTVASDKDNRAGTGRTLIQAPFASPVTLAKATAYRLSVNPSSATSIVLPYLTTYSQTELDALGLGQDCYQTKYNGSWSQDTTIRNMCGLIFDGDDDGTGSGSTGGGPLVGGRLAH